ncbi:MAG: menaquinone biosynthesis family protein [Phycisphaerales bacterium]
MPPTLRIGHSPDPDDAFMWYPLADLDGKGPKVDTTPYRFQHILEDIESLNRRAEKAELEITAISIHQYAYVAKDYALTSCGSSMGDGYGPMVVSPSGRGQFITPAPGSAALAELDQLHLAVPGERTTAFLALSLLLGHKPARYTVVPFDQIIARTRSGEFDAGLIIHEGQLTYGDAGLHCVIDLGKWWTDSRGLPLPLGGNAIRRDLAGDFGSICRILQNSIEYALRHRDEAVGYALNYARDMGRDLADRFVGMYVNDWTLDYGPKGRAAVQRLLTEASGAGITPAVGEIDFVSPGT